MKIWGKLLLIYILLLVGIGWFFKMSFEHFKKEALTLRTATQQTEHASVLQSNQLLADTFFNEVLNREEILAIVQKIVHSDGDERRTQRGLLYRSLSATYQRNKKDIAKILHFHFPNNHSMLRFPKPQIAGGDLTKKRPSVVQVNSSLHAIHGYESGPFVHAWRHVYPLVYHGEHIGSVEVSQPYFELFYQMQELESANQAYFTVFHNKKETFAKLFKGQEQNYFVAELNQNLVRHKHVPHILGEAEEFPAELLPLFTELKNNEQTQANISRGDDFSQYVKFDGTTYSVIFHAVKNVSNKSAGYLLGITPEPQIDSLINKFWIYYLGTALILLWGFIYRGFLQTSLWQRNAQLRQIIDLVPHFIFVKDETGKFEIVNKATAEVFGTTVEDLTGRRDSEFNATEEEVENFRADDLEVIRSGKTKFIPEEPITDSENNLRYLQTTKVPFNSSSTRKPAILGVAVDITERKLAEDALRIERDNLNNIFESMSDGVYIVNQNYDIQYVNQMLQKEFGYYEEQKCYEYFHNRNEICPWCKNEEVFAGNTVRWEFYLTENQKTYDLISSPLISPDGTILKLEILRDITERIQAREALQQAHDELERRVTERTETLKKTHDQLRHAEKLSAVGRFSASIAHEFNNPLCGVVNVIDGISTRAKLSENDQKLAKLALHECDRMKELITNLQQFNKPSPDNRGMVNIEQTIDEILLFAKRELKNKKAQVTKAIPDDLPEIWAVPDQIKQVLINLIGNASDALGSDGGTVSITAASSGKDNITMSIADTGEGIDPASLEHIFEPFFTTKAIKGTGLGLSVTHGIVKSHGGEIDVKSELGKGTTFTLTLPIEMRQIDDKQNTHC